MWVDLYAVKMVFLGVMAVWACMVVYGCVYGLYWEIRDKLKGKV